MKITNVEEFIGATVAKDVLKKSMGDSPEFDIVYEALLQSVNNKEASINETSVEEESYYSKAGVGQRLDELPMRIRKEPVEDLSNNIEYKSTELKWDFEIYKESQNIDINKVETIDNIEIGSNENRIYEAVDKYSEQYGVDRNLVLGIIKQESNFNPDAVSSAGATGVMQLMDFNVEAYGITDPFNIEQNVEGGVRHIKGYLDMFNGDVEMALMAYNGGQGTMERRGVKSSNDIYKMPLETQNYVPKVMDYYKNGVTV